MTDILAAAQGNQTPPIPSGKPQVDAVVLPADKQKKKNKKKTLQTVLILLLLVGAIGTGVYFVRAYTNIFPFAVWHPPRANKFAPYTGPGSTSSGGSSGSNTSGGSGSSTAGTQPPGTYAVYENGASSGKVVGYRYIQAPGVFDGAIKRAASGSTADAKLLASQYGLSGSNLTDAAAHIAAGQTWAPPGVGGINTWHWTTCTNQGTGLNGTGCDVTTKSGGNGSNPNPTPTPTPVSPTGTPTPTPTPASTPTPGPADTPTPTQPQQIVYITPTPTPTPMPPPASCNSKCTINSDCVSGLVCIDAACRNASCTTSTNCICSAAPQPTPKTPVSGGPTVLGASVIGIGTIILLLGLAL